MYRTFLLVILVLLFYLAFVGQPVSARGIYQSPSVFLAESFKQNVPDPQLIWLSGNLRKTASDILTHKPGYLRVRYWADAQQSAWILEEIGKEKPITVGILIKDTRIIRLRVLEFRESRGDEVRYDFFTRQFDHAGLKPTLQLDKKIDGITGATLSVRALTRLARLALYLDQQRKLTHDSP